MSGFRVRKTVQCKAHLESDSTAIFGAVYNKPAAQSIQESLESDWFYRYLKDKCKPLDNASYIFPFHGNTFKFKSDKCAVIDIKGNSCSIYQLIGKDVEMTCSLRSYDFIDKRSGNRIVGSYISAQQIKEIRV